MAAAAKSGGLPKFTGNGQPVPGGTNLPNQNWTNVGYQVPGMNMPVPGNDDLAKYLQQVIYFIPMFWVYVEAARWAG